MESERASERWPPDRSVPEEVLLALGAAQEYDAVTQAIADGARLITGAALVTLTLPTADETGMMIRTSGGGTETTGTPDADPPSALTFSLSEQEDDPRAMPLLHFYGAGDALDGQRIALLTRFAPHARLALERARHLTHLHHLANTDPLTRLANLRGLRDALGAEATAANRDGTPLALLIIDLDDFRRYNTLWGHLVGDAALIAFARAIHSAVRDSDLVARIGGEEFAVLLRNADDAEARAVAEQIHRAIAAGSAGLPSPFTASIGIGLYPDDVPDATILFAVADMAMAMAKAGGKNRTYAFEMLAASPPDVP